ncbi:hypothetical protein [Nostoc sp. UHCC 0252]|uniref:hypothetical protein n=1 Tax=Nostoc sp. UHCC 0252 TaxID=3110241 RepID=UPI002B207F0D|nr:hypothetical protein [Nostoc sp. UHCC 0252]MEA5600686.1 hypothetical protein [Nostoc sp. UHCC 0252]
MRTWYYLLIALKSAIAKLFSFYIMFDSILMSLQALRGNPKPLRLLSLRDATRTFHFVAFAMTII